MTDPLTTADSTVPTQTASTQPADGSDATGRAELVLVIGLTVLAGLVAVVAVAFLPFRLGVVPVPVGVAVAAAGMAWLPRACFRLTRSVPAAAAPLVVWFLVTAVLALTRNKMYSGYPLVTSDWRVLLLLAVGALTGAWAVGGAWGAHARGRVQP